jgi:hypothetical protein
MPKMESNPFVSRQFTKYWVRRVIAHVRIEFVNGMDQSGFLFVELSVDGRF